MSIKLSSKLSCADTRILKGIRTVATLLCSMLPVCGVLSAQPAQAHDFMLRHASITNVLINSNANWNTIRFVSFNFNHSHSCLVVASGDVENPGGTVMDQQYRFTVTIDDPNPPTDGSAERTIELRDNADPPVDDPNIHPVATNQVFFAVAAGQTHFIRFLGRKVGAAIDAFVSDASLSVVCIGG